MHKKSLRFFAILRNKRKQTAPVASEPESDLSGMGLSHISLSELSTPEIIDSPIFKLQRQDEEMKRIGKIHRYRNELRKKHSTEDRDTVVSYEGVSAEDVFKSPEFGVAISDRNLKESPALYPGSSKGRLPEDDPEFFKNWYQQNLGEQARYERSFKPNNKLLEQEYTIVDMNLNTFIYDRLDSTAMIDVEDNPDHTLYYDSAQFKTNLDFKMDLPQIPTNMPLHQEDVFQTCMNWGFMRSLLSIDFGLEHLNRLNDEAEKEGTGDVPYKLDEEVNTGYYPSIFAYYQLLPKKMRENTHINSTVRALERFGYYLTIQQKQEMLNRACRFACPPSETDKVVVEGLDKSRKYHPSTKDQLEVMFPDTEEGIHSRRKYVKEDEFVDWARPPRNLDPFVVKDTWERAPLEYYDNDDGFYDSYIAFKEKRRGNVPLPIERNSFKH